MPAKKTPYPYAEPDALSLTQLEIEDTADRCSQNWGYKDGCMMDEVAHNAGLDVEYSHDPNEIMLEVPLDAKPVIWLPRKGRKRDDRVVIATALGHWALQVEKAREAHPGCGIQALYKPDNTAALKEAETFGFSLLMPRQSFVDAWQQGKSQAASDQFDVPTTVAYLRAQVLELGDTL